MRGGRREAKNLKLLDKINDLVGLVHKQRQPQTLNPMRFEGCLVEQRADGRVNDEMCHGSKGVVECRSTLWGGGGVPRTLGPNCRGQSVTAQFLLVAIRGGWV